MARSFFDRTCEGVIIAKTSTQKSNSFYKPFEIHNLVDALESECTKFSKCTAHVKSIHFHLNPLGRMPTLHTLNAIYRHEPKRMCEIGRRAFPVPTKWVLLHWAMVWVCVCVCRLCAMWRMDWFERVDTRRLINCGKLIKSPISSELKWIDVRLLKWMHATLQMLLSFYCENCLICI